MKLLTTSILFCSFLKSLDASIVSLRRAPNGAATVDLSKNNGFTEFKASGFIYGWPDKGTEADSSIPENLVRDIKFNACRAGGAQISARGWSKDGYQGYLPRMQSALSNYRTTRRYNGTFILLIHDLWGADGGSIAKYPGDNGNWTEVDNFFQQVAKDLVAYDMLKGLVLDLWNEPDITIFWDRPWAQYLQYYVRAHNFFKKALSNTLISGPSAAHSPIIGNANWIAWMKTVKGNNTIPDIYSWHQIGSWEREPDLTIPDFNSMKASNGLPDRPIDINEYAAKDEQNPANSVYYIAQLERHNLRGLRANWGGGSALHDFMANLVYKQNGGTYQGNGEWNVYKYYAQMVGNRVATSSSSDRRFDVFATKSGNTAKMIAGTRSVGGTYQIQVSGLTSLGLPLNGSISVQIYRFDWAGENGSTQSPINLGTATYPYSSGVVSLL